MLTGRWLGLRRSRSPIAEESRTPKMNRSVLIGNIVCRPRTDGLAVTLGSPLVRVPAAGSGVQGRSRQRIRVAVASLRMTTKSARRLRRAPSLGRSRTLRDSRLRCDINGENVRRPTRRGTEAPRPEKNPALWGDKGGVLGAAPWQTTRHQYARTGLRADLGTSAPNASVVWHGSPAAGGCASGTIGAGAPRRRFQQPSKVPQCPVCGAIVTTVRLYTCPDKRCRQGKRHGPLTIFQPP
jgi:hypothetical protein